MTAPDPTAVEADDDYVEQIRRGAYPDDQLGQLLAILRDDAQRDPLPEWQPFVPAHHFRHVALALLALTVLLLGLAVVVPSRAWTVAVFLLAVCTWTGWLVVLVVAGFDRDMERER